MNGWVSNREAVDLRHHRVHYGVSVNDAFYLVLITVNTDMDSGKYIEFHTYKITVVMSYLRTASQTFSALLAICVENSPVTGEFPAQRPVTRSFDVFFDFRLNKRLSKQSWGWWFAAELIMTSSYWKSHTLVFIPENTEMDAGKCIEFHTFERTVVMSYLRTVSQGCAQRWCYPVA